MKQQPLWLDISDWQGDIDFDKIAAIEGDNKVYGVISRTGKGKYGGVADPSFARNWSESKKFAYRSSYWAYWDYFPLRKQLDLMFQACPTIDIIPRFWDMEIEMASSQFLSEQTWLASEEVFAHDGKRFIIYSRKNILERTLCKYWTEEQLNMHYYVLAQYDTSTPENPSESNGIAIPAGISKDRILWKQTSSDFEIYPGSGPVDRDRWIWTDTAGMHDQIQEMWGEEEPEPPCCEEIGAELERVWTSFGNHNVANEEEFQKLKASMLVLEVKMNGIIESQKAVGKEILTLQGEIKRLDTRIDGLAGGHDHPNWMKILGWVK